MDILRRITIGIACALLPVLLFIFGLSFSLHRVFGTPDALKNALSESGVYNSAAGNIVAIAQKDASKTAERAAGKELHDVPLDQPAVKEAVEKAFPGSSLQPQVEKVIDQAYKWVHGDSQQLNISLDLGKNKEDLLTNLTNYAKEHAASLPVCPAGVGITSDFNVFSAECLPNGVTPDMAAIAAREKLQESEFFKQETPLDANTIKSANGQTLNDRLHGAQSAYRTGVKTIYYVGAAALVLTLLAIFLSRPIRDGLKRVAKIFLCIGISTILLAVASVFLTGKLADMLAKSAGNTPSFQSSITDAVHLLASDVRGWWLGYGIALFVLGLGAFIALKILSEKDTLERNNAKPPEQRPHVVIN